MGGGGRRCRNNRPLTHGDQRDRLRYVQGGVFPSVLDGCMNGWDGWING